MEEFPVDGEISMSYKDFTQMLNKFLVEKEVIEDLIIPFPQEIEFNIGSGVVKIPFIKQSTYINITKKEENG